MPTKTTQSTPDNLIRQDKNTRLYEERQRLLGELKAAENSGSRIKINRAKYNLEANSAAFCEANKGLALSMARKFMRVSSPHSDDYVQDAMVGLLEAWQRWDPNQSTFATFSRNWIAGRIRQGVRLLEYSLLSKADFDARPEALRCAHDLEESLGREPTDSEVAAKTGIRESVVGRVRRAKTSSLDAPTGDGTTNLGDVVATTGAEELFEDDDERWNFVISTAPLLTARQLFIMARHLGLDGAPPQTLAEIGVITGFGREPARKEEERAKQRLLGAGIDLPDVSLI